MTVIHPDISEEQSFDQPTSPGPRLREARLVRKMSLDEVSAHLHLDRKLIEALENDDYEQLSEPTFVRGYLRGYARLLNLPPAPIIEAYDRHGFALPDLIPDIASKPQAKSSDISVRLATYLVVAVLVVLMVAWWQTQKNTLDTRAIVAETGKDVQPAGPQTEPESAPLQHYPIPVESIPAQHAPGSTETVPAQGEPVVVITPPVEDVEDEDEETAAAAMEPMEETLPDTGQPLTEEAPGDAVITPPPPEDTPEAEAEAQAASPPSATSVELEPRSLAAEPVQPAAATELDSLVINFKHDSWLEISDKTEQRIFFDLARAGQAVSLEGAAPFQVIVGYARGVRIEYNGAPFDHGPFTKGQVARFTLGSVGD